MIEKPAGFIPKVRGSTTTQSLNVESIMSELDDGTYYVPDYQRDSSHPISDMDLSRWKDGGYQQHLAQQERLAFVRANRDAAADLVNGDDTTLLPEATLQIIASQYFDLQ